MVTTPLLLSALACGDSSPQAEPSTTPDAVAHKPEVVVELEPEAPPQAPVADHAPIESRLASNQRLRPVVEKFMARLQEKLEAMEASSAAGDFEELAKQAEKTREAVREAETE